MSQLPYQSHPDTAPGPIPSTGRSRPVGARLVDARLAGLLYLVIIVFGLFSEVFVRARLTVPGDPVATAENLRGAEALFRLGFVANLGYLLCEVVLVVVLYHLLRPVSRTVSMVAAAFRFGCVTISALNLLNMLAAIVVLDQSGRAGFGAGQPEALALLFLDLHRYGYALALTFFALNCAAMAYLLVRSSHVPTSLGLLLGVAGLGYLVSSLAAFLAPGSGGTLLTLLLAPALVAEVWLCLLLLIRGGGPEIWAEPPAVQRSPAVTRAAG
ncbi:DUF4386 domain-containing protein [Plantactinospora sp. WMMC1484]|uniref:DUF4386 domain-containing protein n=1 Tax=Plantactinospora sp. WMMC1484 TaxID=3404122 RepID=UPI003BF5A847